MRGSVGSNINRRKLTAKYKKTPDTTAVKGTTSTPTNNKSLTPQTSVSKGKRTTLSRRTPPPPERVIEEKIVPVTGEIATQGTTLIPVREEIRKPTEARDLQDRVISSEIDEDGNRTGRWDANKDMKEMWHVEKFIRGIISPYEQPVQMVKNIYDELPPEKQTVKDTGLDLVINPVMETLAGAKDMGLTDKDFYWPDQLTGIDHPSAPAFLRTGGGSGSDILGGLANNLGYIADVATHKESGNIIAQKYEGEAARFIEQPAYYVGSAIGEIPLWFIGVGQAKAAVTISSKVAVTAVKMTAATGKLPGPSTIKAIVQTERASTAVDKNIIKAKSLLVDADQGKIVNAKLPKNLDRAVNAALNVIKKDQDIPLQNKIDALGVKKTANKTQQRALGQEISQMKKEIAKAPGPSRSNSNLKVKIKSKQADIAILKRKFKVTENSIKDQSKQLNMGVLRKQFKDFKRQNKSKDNNIARSSKAQYIEWIETKIQPEITRKYKELPNQVDVIRDTKLMHLQSGIDSIKTSANKLVGSKNIDRSFWEQSSVHNVGNQLSDSITPIQRKKLIKLRNRKLDIELEIQRISSNENWAPFGNTIRTLENIPSKTKSSWENRWKTEARIDGDNETFGMTYDGASVKMDDIFTTVDGKTPLKPEKRSYGGQSGRLWGMLDYHRDNISKLRNKQVTDIAEHLRDNFLDVGWIKKSEFISAQKQIDETVKPKIEKELSALVEQRTVYQTQKTDLQNSGVTFSKYTTKSRGQTTSTMNTKMDSSIQRKIDDLDVSISKKNEEISVQEKLLDKADSYVSSNLSGVIPGKGKSKDKYYFEPSFLKQYMGDEYQKMMPDEILYPKRPITKATRIGNKIEVQLGSEFNSPGGMIEGIVSVKAPVVPKGRIKKTVKRFIPNNKIRNRGMTLDNTEFIFTKQADNPMATDVIRMPVNAPDDIKDLLVRGYYQKVSNSEKPNIKFLQGLTGGETSELWVARSIPDKNKDPNAWDERDINVGQSSNFAAKDSQLDKTNNMLRSYNEIMDTRAVLTNDKNTILDQRINTLTENKKSYGTELSSLYAKVGIDDVTLTKTEKKRMSFLKKQIADDEPELRKLQKRSDNQSDENLLFAKYGVGFGQRRGLVGKYDLAEGKNTKPINQSPVIKNRKTGKFYYVAEVANQRKIYELDDPSIADKIRPTNVEVATVFPETSFGATEYGLVSETSKIEAPGRAAVFTPSAYNKDVNIPFMGPIIGRKATKEITSKYKEDNYIILGSESETPSMLRSKGIRELTTAEISEFEKGATFSKIVGDIRDDLRNIDTKPDNVTPGSAASKSIKKQMTDFIKINARTKTLSALESGSVKVKNIKKSIIGNDDWVMMQKTSLRVDDDMYDNLVSGGGIRVGSDELSSFAKSVSADKEPLVVKSDIPDVEDQVPQLRWMPLDEISNKKPVTGLDMYNVIDLGITGGRKRGEIESGWVRDSVTRREYDTYLNAKGEKDAYEELLFAAKMNGSERIFRTNLVISYEKMRGKKFYDTPDSTVRTEASKKSTAEIDQKIDDMVKYEDDPVTKLPKFVETNDDYISMVADIKENNLLREVTLKDRAKVVGRRGAKPAAKTVEQRAGLISIKYNFGELSKSLPSHSLVGRITNRAVSKLQSTDNFFTGGLLTGFREKLNYKLNKKALVDTMDDPDDLEGFHQAIEFMQRNSNPVDRMNKAKYDTTKGRVDSRYGSIKMTREERFKSYVEDKGGVSMWVESDLTDAEKLRIKKLNDKMDSIDRYLDITKKRNPNAPLTSEGRKQYLNAKSFLDPEFRGPVPDEINKMWDDIGEFETSYSSPGSDKTNSLSLSSPKITHEQRVKRLEQASIELALEKTRIEKKYIDSGEYSNYSVKIRELQQEKANILGWDNKFVSNVRPSETRFKTGFGNRRGINMFSKQADQDVYVESLDFNIRYLKSQQGKPTHTTAMGTTSLTDENTDIFYTIKNSSDNIVAQGSNLKGADLPQSILIDMQRKGVFDNVISKDTKWDSDAVRTKAWDDVTDGMGPDSSIVNAKKLLLDNGYNVNTPGMSGEVTRVTKGKNTTYHYKLPNISGQSDTRWDALQQRERIAEYSEQGFDVNKILPAQEFKANRQQLPDERGTLVHSSFHHETLDAIDTWQKADIASKKNPKPLTNRFIKWRDSQKQELGKRVKPTNIKFGEDGTIVSETVDLLVKDGWKVEKLGVNREEFFMADISTTSTKVDSDIRIEVAKQSYLKDMGVDTKALTPMSDILKKMKEKKTSLNAISDARAVLFDTKSTPVARKQAKATMKGEKASVSAINNDLSKLQSAYATQKPQTTIQQTRQMPAPAEVKVKFLSFSQSDLAPDYRGKSKSSTSVSPLVPAFSGVLSTVNALPKTDAAVKQTISVKTNEAFADDGKLQQPISTKSVTDITSGLDLSLPSLMAGLKINSKLQPAQSGRLDANLGWLSAQLPGQITRPLTDVGTVTRIDSAMRLGTQLRTSSILKLSQAFKLKTSIETPIFKKYQDTSFQSIYQKQPRRQATLPVMLSALPWQLAEERARKRKKKPKRKSAKTWWQTPDNWYESNYWGKDGKGSGYMTFKGSEPKRLKDKKNEFGF